VLGLFPKLQYSVTPIPRKPPSVQPVGAVRLFDYFQKLKLTVCRDFAAGNSVEQVPTSAAM